MLWVVLLGVPTILFNSSDKLLNVEIHAQLVLDAHMLNILLLKAAIASA